VGSEATCALKEHSISDSDHCLVHSIPSAVFIFCCLCSITDTYMNALNLNFTDKGCRIKKYF
jgi:hypothetical protein